MRTIIDIDAHFEPGHDWLEPYPELAARLPKLDPARLAVHTIVGDLLRDVPEAQRPPVAELLPPGLLTLFGEEKAGEAARRAEFAGKQQFQKANASARVKWLDGQGIAIQNVICLSGIAQTLRQIHLADEFGDSPSQCLDPFLRAASVFWNIHCLGSWAQMRSGRVRVEGNDVRQDDGVGNSMWDVR